jgi:hypothetical protein
MFALNREILHTFPKLLEGETWQDRSKPNPAAFCLSDVQPRKWPGYIMTLRFLVTRAADYERSIDSRETIYWKQQKNMFCSINFLSKTGVVFFEDPLNFRKPPSLVMFSPGDACLPISASSLSSASQLHFRQIWNHWCHHGFVGKFWAHFIIMFPIKLP